MPSDLLVRPRSTHGLVHDITVESARTPLSADWAYVGFQVHALKAGESASATTGDR